MAKLIPFLSNVAAVVIAIDLFNGVANGQSKLPNSSSINADAGKQASRKRKVGSDRAQNSILSRELVWKFSGGTQRGWYLYTALIKQLIGTEAVSSSNQFANALKEWQATVGLAPSGILDAPSIEAMVRIWQSRRIKNRAEARPDQLITAPASDFLYKRSAKDRKVEPDAYAAYKRLVAAAVADESLKLAHDSDGGLAPGVEYLRIISAFRLREDQAKIRARSKIKDRKRLAHNSTHFTGRTLDLFVGGSAIDASDSNRAIQVHDPVYLWLVRNAHRFGFRPYFYEPWHWEHVK